jgi:transketolase
MVSLFYVGIIDLNIKQATATNQDLSVLSKGHAVATRAFLYSHLGYSTHPSLRIPFDDISLPE